MAASMVLIMIAPVSAGTTFAQAGTSSQGGIPYVKSTVVLANGSVFKGNFVPQGQLEVPQGEGGVALDTSTGRLYVTNLFDNISVLNDKTLSTVSRIQVGGEPFDVVYDPVNGNVYASNLEMQLNVIDGKNMSLVSNITTGTFSSRMAINTASNTMYLPNLLNQSYEKISLNGTSRITNVSIGSNRSTLKHPVQGIAFDSMNNTVFASNFQTSKMMVLNASTNRIVRNITFSGQIGVVSYDRSTNSVVFAITGDQQIISMNASTYEVQGNMTSGRYPSSIAFDNSAGYIFVTDEGNSTVSVFNMGNYSRVGSISVSSGPTGAFFDPGMSRLYIINSGSGTLSVIQVNSTSTAPLKKTLEIVIPVVSAALILGVILLWRRRNQHQNP